MILPGANQKQTTALRGKKGSFSLAYPLSPEFVNGIGDMSNEVGRVKRAF